MALVVVVGAGIAGLAAALALKPHAEVVVLERRSASEANFGAGIQIPPNAFRALKAIGAAEAVAAESAAPDGLTVFSGTRPITRLPYRDAMERRFGAPYRTASRAALHATLARAVEQRGIEVRYGVDIAAVEPADDGVRVPHVGTAAMLVAADGVRSAVRDRIVGDRAIDTGWTAWRGRGAAVESRDVELRLGPGHHLVRYPLGREAENCVLVARAPAAPDTIVRGVTGRAMAGVETWQPWTIRVRQPHVFHAGRIAFAGDAAHAMLPFLAQGGAMAVEDAAVLGLAVAVHGVGPAAVDAYAQARRKRTARVAALVEQQGRIYHLPFPLSAARDVALRRFGPEGILRRMGFIWGWSPDA